jgi:ABC-2 type transport system ATP-binding protein
VAADPAIHAESLVKRFGSTMALNGLDLKVEEGTLLALLGPNGAGKTTAVRILTTLLKPDSGRASVAGSDVVQQADRLKSSIGLAGQEAAIDEYLTGRENLEMIGRLYHLAARDARRRAVELLEQFAASVRSPSLTPAGPRSQVLQSAAWIVGILLVFVPLSIARYRRTTRG